LIEALLKAVDVLKLLRDEVETHRAADVDVEAIAAAVERRAGLREPLPAETVKQKSGKHAALATDAATHRITVVLEPSKWTAVRALQVLLALGETGKVVSSDPHQAEIETEDAQIGDLIIVDLHTTQPESALHEALNRVPELGSVIVETLAPPVVNAKWRKAVETTGGPPDGCNPAPASSRPSASTWLVSTHC
jgi:hypothetical protein